MKPLHNAPKCRKVWILFGIEAPSIDMRPLHNALKCRKASRSLFGIDAPSIDMRPLHDVLNVVRPPNISIDMKPLHHAPIGELNFTSIL